MTAATTSTTGQSKKRHDATLSPTMHKFVQEKTERSKKLASGYSQEKRWMEIASICAFSAFFVFNLLIIWPYVNYTTAVLLLSATLVGMLSADFVSGLIHWAADTWGTVEWPVVGNTFIRSFREHHIDPAAITRHDAVETNGDNCLISITFMLPPHIFNLLYFGVLPHFNMELNYYQVFFLLCTTTLGLFGALTNQIHKWAHTFQPPFIVRKLQDYGVILTRQNHLVHHKSPFDCYYCITTGWLNPIFTKIGFWRHLETTISFVTGLEPRSDDMKWNDHVNLLGK